MNEITHVAVDIAKSVFQIHAADRNGHPLWRPQLRRSQWITQLCQKVPTSAVIAMEACAGSHWARLLQAHGYTVKLIDARYVKPYVKSNKNDRADAEAICEALTRPGMRFVTPKTVAQQDMQALHRIRSALVKDRTAKANQIRGLVGERGIVAPEGINKLRSALPQWCECVDSELSMAFRFQLRALYEDLKRLDERVAELDKQIAQQVKEDPVARRLMELRGVGPLSALALAVALGDARQFKRARDFAASLGLAPRQHSSGGKPRLLGISKRGDAHLRFLMVHGARSVLKHVASRDDVLSRWASRMLERKHPNVVTVALANKTARMAWAMVAK